MNDKDKIIDDINQISNKESQDSSDEVIAGTTITAPYSLFYSFFLIPLMIVIFGSAFYLLFYKITEEPNDINLLLDKLEVGSQRDKSDASIALNRLFFEDQSTYDSSYRNRIIGIHRSSQTDKHSDPVQRLHTIMVMGNSGDKGFGDILIDELSSKDSEFRIKAIESLGKLRYLKAA